MEQTPGPELLRAFLEIVENGSFTTAARRLHRTQAAVSMQIKRLEDQLGCRLFDRGGGTVRLTAEGESFYDHARRILRSYAEALAAVGNRQVEGDVVIGMPDDIALAHLPAIIRLCATRFPAIRINVACEPSRRLLALLADGTLDLAVVTEGEGGANGTVLRRTRPVWACRAESSVFDENPVPLAIFHTGDVFRRSAIERLEACGRRARVSVISASFAGVRAAVHAGVAVAVIFLETVESPWRILGPADGYPELPELGILMVPGKEDTLVVREISDVISAVIRNQ